jgi:hypothetical protein
MLSSSTRKPLTHFPTSSLSKSLCFLRSSLAPSSPSLLSHPRSFPFINISALGSSPTTSLPLQPLPLQPLFLKPLSSSNHSLPQTTLFLNALSLANHSHPQTTLARKALSQQVSPPSNATFTEYLLTSPKWLRKPH